GIHLPEMGDQRAGHGPDEAAGRPREGSDAARRLAPHGGRPRGGNGGGGSGGGGRSGGGDSGGRGGDGRGWRGRRRGGGALAGQAVDQILQILGFGGELGGA